LSDTLLLAGIAVLVAVAVGGGLTIFGVNIPVIKSRSRGVILVGVAGGLIVGGLAFRESDESKVEIAGISFSREGEGVILGLPDIALQLRNPGKKVAFVTRVEVDVKRSWQLQPTNFVAFGGFKAADRKYDADVSLASIPYVDRVSVSQALDPNSVDRFDLNLSLADAKPDRDHILLMSVTVVYDERQARSTSSDFLVVTNDPRYRYLNYDEPNNPLTEISAKNRQVLEEINRLDALRSDELEDLIRDLLR